MLQLAGMTLVHIMYRFNMKFQLVVALAVVALLVAEYKAYKKQAVDMSRLYMGLFAYFIAQITNFIDLQRYACDPDHTWLHGHVL